MRIYFQRDETGNVDRVYLTVRHELVHTTKPLAKTRDGKTVINVDRDKRNEILGIEVIGKIRFVETTTKEK